jgi:hypothetical protein
MFTYLGYKKKEDKKYEHLKFFTITFAINIPDEVQNSLVRTCHGMKWKIYCAMSQPTNKVKKHTAFYLTPNFIAVHKTAHH